MRVRARASTMISISTSPVPKDTSAAACPSPSSVPRCPLTSDCNGPSIPAKTVAIVSTTTEVARRVGDVLIESSLIPSARGSDFAAA